MISTIFIILFCILVVFTIYTFNKKEDKPNINSRSLSKSTNNEKVYSDSVSTGLRHELIILKQSEQKVRAIKELRDATGWSLSKCKEYIDGLN